ncbi:DUF305 domain-containing protein [Sediminibacterium soli]|uniref:DUF305 domain-containing protein n=1 Tax=Sediminibacterium soli TaxID=2698829 RepID=UPI00137A21F4|nr:DUF305 domain-containing protein [Sediminibacterium soli]NCI46707.1 DUF305 domain-containing protein [Sediminibacterium soli]
MKNVLKVLAIFLFTISIASCSKDDDTIKIQKHDDNQMMSIMHSMMDTMMGMQKTNDADNDFAMMMRMHHQGAIEMSNAELKSGDDAQMKEMAQMIIDAQAAEIEQLTTFLNAHSPHGNVPEFSMQQMANMERSGKVTDLQIINGDTDHDFAMLMIQHHQSAIENARLELIYGHEDAMKTMARNIIEAQDQEIKDLQQWILSDGK